MVKVNKERCKLCGLCVSFCPMKRLEIKGKTVVEIKDIKCTKCKMCEQYCPDLAIEVEE